LLVGYHACVPTRIVTVAAAKGGVGKTTLAYELAAALEAVLVDLDWDTGGATKMWGYDTARFKTAPLLDALERGPNGKAPRPKTRPKQPALLPAHPDLAASQIPDDLIADCLTAWAGEWDYPFVVVDTHPGANPLTDGAMQAADLILVPVVLAAREMDALEGMLRDFAGYPLLLVPTMVPASPSRRFIDRLGSIAGGTSVAPPISEHRWLRRRLRRAAITLEPNPGKHVAKAADEFLQIAKTVEERLA
jgi:chromosome partitioning protein